MNEFTTINFLGDIALFSRFEERDVDPFQEVEMPTSDYNIGNFEFIIPKENKAKRFFDVSDSYKVSHDYLMTLKLDKFNAFSLANNHCMDYGQEGISDVIKILNNKGIENFGFGKNEFNILNKKIGDLSIAVLAFVKKGRWSQKSNDNVGPDNYDVSKIIKKIEDLKKHNHHIIIYPHWGTELVDVPNPIDVINARKFIDSGASAVIGHHPHIIQGMEYYRGKPIWYSLGSFIYVPECELGYDSNQGTKRNYSICLNIKLSKDKLESNPYFYFYEKESLLPKPIKSEVVFDYFREINSFIGNKSLYNRSIRKALLKREIKSFFHRFKKSPIKTTLHYIKYLKADHLKKIIK